ncbi:lysylphosphatidylglycerol synthase transmembrane domain-containing protein [Rhizobium brockwellii]|uniref:Lysylphosphatidylglycerol synthase transmembrane domain-containing protein n=1 Tax=Rhizobium brockwellii TaxID=3019932 RepID=A0ABU3YQE6_9HYPH|nr:lysylphosphatidylglycerol synthase transmembrane domain-containing protein [Rhizobium brockwellii]QIO55507.1 flippase-like domain-containing protein [Rhizobium leguminosarum bv. trifolii]TAY84899.1 flippase-like domain-containing protein [Rhizobium leguminosarum]MDV4180582.1 lysylphosphatidylglycerol synthase transmembrane domain-containing protein [Rhizobium brockwellii]MDV4187942.1 lysylphosphatidylglycerol synthase transmembrane domain-containing protein [Rhizobium brockwellii]TAZ02336.1
MTTPSSPALLRIGIPVLKVAVALGLVIWIARRVDFSEGWAAVQTLSATTICGSILLLLLQALLSAWRWCLLSDMIGQRLKMSGAMKLFMQSLFYNQALPSPIPGDAARIFGAVKYGLTIREATLGVVMDRILTLFGLAVVALIGLIILRAVYGHDFPIPYLTELTALGVAGTIASALVFSWRRHLFVRFFPAKLHALTDALRALVTHQRMVGVFLLTLAIHGLSVVSLEILVLGIGLPLDWGQAAAAFPPVLLIAMVPISVGGWGLREGGMIISLAVFGIGTTDAATLSVVFGLLQLVVGLAGGVFVFSRPHSGKIKAL